MAESIKEFVERRLRDYDRLDVNLPSGMSKFVKLLALRRGLGVSALVRKAILTDAGLRRLPVHYSEEIDNLITTYGSVDNIPPKMINSIFHRWQDEENADNLQKLLDDQNRTIYRVTMNKVDSRMLYELFQKKIKHPDTKNPIHNPITNMDDYEFKINGADLALLLRFLSNIR